jgi:hypothetical protein
MWAVYGAGLVGTLMHVQNQIHYSIAATQLWLSIAWFRVAATLPDCRAFGLLEGACLVLTGISIIIVGWYDLRRTWIGLLPVLIQPMWVCILSSVLPHRLWKPLNVEYHHPKFQGMGMVVMGQMVIVAATPPASGEGPHDYVRFYTDAISTIFILVMFKLIMTDCDVTLPQNHGIIRSNATKTIWVYFCQPLLNLSIVSVAAGIGFVHKSTNHGHNLDEAEHQYFQNRGHHFIGYFSAGIFLAILIGQMTHKRERAVEFPNVRRFKVIYLSVLGTCAAACIVLPAFPIDPLPVIAVLNVIAAKVGWITKTAVLVKRQALLDAPESVNLATK